MSDTIAIMREGRIVQFGTPRELYDAPVNRYVADFVGESNLLRRRGRQRPAAGRASRIGGRHRALGAAVCRRHGRPLAIGARRPCRGAAGGDPALARRDARPPAASTRASRAASTTASISAITTELRRDRRARRHPGAGAETRPRDRELAPGDAVALGWPSTRSVGARRDWQRLHRRSGDGRERLNGQAAAASHAARHKLGRTTMKTKEFINQLRRWQKRLDQPPAFPGRHRSRRRHAGHGPRARHRPAGPLAFAGEIGDRVSLCTWPSYHDQANFEAFTAADRRRRRDHRLRLERGDDGEAAGGRRRLRRAGADQLHDQRLCGRS